MRLWISDKIELPELGTDVSEPGIRGLLEFAAKGVGHSGVEIHIRRSTSDDVSGRCYYPPFDPMCRVADTTRYLITMLLPATTLGRGWRHYTHNPYGLKWVAAKYPSFPFDNWRDVFVNIAAHEFRHVWQHRRTLRTAKGGKVEHDAEMHAIRMTNAWRLSTGRSEILPIKQANPFARTSPGAEPSPWSSSQYNPGGLLDVVA